MRDGARMTLVGVAIGFPLAVVLGRLLSVAMFDVSPYDPLVLTASAILLTAVALAAGFVPALRASRIDPMTALRYE